MARDRDELEEIYEPEQLILSDLINRVLDKGVVITANITISIADIDLIQLDLRLLISSVATLVQRQQVKQDKRDHLLVRPRSRK
jgi:gas vesicle structural protein